MKYIVILCDGMSDLSVPELGGKTPMEYAHKPNMDKLASTGEMGFVKTVADDLQPGSDVANLSVLGYDPHIYYSGRSPLEAVSMGVELLDTDMTFRTNLVTLSDDKNYADKIMLDYSSDEISTAEARELINCVNEAFATDEIKFYGGISYRHLMVWNNMDKEFKLTPPHDISDKCVADYLPDNEIIRSLMEKSYEVLKKHPINLDRIARGLKPANSIWIWGNGKKPALANFKELYGMSGAVISAVDLIKGIGICAGLDVIEVEGATGNVHTNFDGKAEAAIKALEDGADFVYVHMEAPDEAGHRHEVENKVKAIELIDEKIVERILTTMGDKKEDYKMMILPDHPTPLKLKTHTSDPVPYIIFDSRDVKNSSSRRYTEQEAADTGVYVEEGYMLMPRFLS